MTGRDVYVGMTDDLLRRGLEHADRFDIREMSPGDVLSRQEARAVEEAMIMRAGGTYASPNPDCPYPGIYQNLRHEVAISRDIHSLVVEWGENWLTSRGL